MAYFGSTIIFLWIISALLWIAGIAFVSLDEDCKSPRWLWILIMALLGPVGFLPYFIWGRER